jgi:hypothetical protein
MKRASFSGLISFVSAALPERPSRYRSMAVVCGIAIPCRPMRLKMRRSANPPIAPRRSRGLGAVWEFRPRYGC